MQQRNPVLVVVGVVLGVVMLGGAALLSVPGATTRVQPGATSSTAASSPAAAPSDAQPSGEQPTPELDPEEQAARDAFLRSLARRDPADPAAWGVPDAPVVVIEWADYRCPFCSAFNEQILPELAHYVEAGKVRFEFRDLAVFGEESVLAAVGARAAGLQGKQIEFMHALFVALPDEGHPPVDESVLVAAARVAGVADLERFTADLGSQELRTAVLAETADAQRMGLGSVPAFVVGTQFVQGAQPASVFQQVIDAELTKVPQ